MAHSFNDCIVCGAHFDSLKALDAHNRAEHLRKSVGNERPRQQEPSNREAELRADEPTSRF